MDKNLSVFLTFADATDRLSRNVGKTATTIRFAIFPEELRSHQLRGGSLKSRIFFASITRHNIMHGLSQKTVEHAESGFREQRAEKKTKPPKVLGRTCGV
jgi:hypothetical protein